tara:strand:+ start:484 stop:612 length:129 start_codon:yes stop_codon:yes gene_type:complete
VLKKGKRFDKIAERSPGNITRGKGEREKEEEGLLKQEERISY